MELDDIKVIEVSESKATSSVNIKSRPAQSNMTSLKGSIMSDKIL